MFMIKKPKPVECRQWTGDNAEELEAWSDARTAASTAGDDVLTVETPHGYATCAKGDYVFKGAPDDFYPVSAAFVAENYNEQCEAQQVECGPCTEYTLTPFDIGIAIGYMRSGNKVRRAGWNGKGMFIVLMPELRLPPHSSQEPGAKVNDRTAKHIGVDTPLNSRPYIALFNARGEWQPGWVCSQEDLLANDWEVAE